MNKIKQKLKNQKGFTLVEILVVIVIIGILFTVILPRIDFASEKARQTGVKTDFRSFATASEQYLRQNAGQNLNINGLNSFLDKALQIQATGLSTKKDPWGVAYKVEIDSATPGKPTITVQSLGKGKAGAGKPDFLSTSYYFQGAIDMCTAGLDGGDIELQSFNVTTTPEKVVGSSCGNAVTTSK